MKILFIPHNGKPYGANKSLLTLMKYLNEKNEILIISPFNNSMSDEFSKNNISSINIPFFPSIFFIKKKIKYLLYPALMILNIFTLPILIYQVLRFKPDIIYSNSTVENMGFLLSMILGIKHITHVREFGDLDYNFKSIFGKSFKRWYLNQNSGLIFNSNIVLETVLPKKFQKIPCVTIYNGLEDNAIKCNAKILNANKVRKIGIVGYIHEGKRQLIAIQYLKKLLLNGNNFELHLYGQGDRVYVDRIKEYITINNLDKKVFLEGFIKDPSIIYNNLDLLVVFAMHEAFGRVTVEAMQKGIPVLGYNGGGTLELINNGIDGFLFSDEKSFVENFKILMNNPQVYQMISKNSIKKIESTFSEDIYVRNIEKFLINILNINRLIK